MTACRDLAYSGIRSVTASFGMTESSCSIAWDDKDIYPIQGGSVGVGRPIPGAKVKICAPESKTSLESEQTGELHLGGYQVINGYLGTEDSSIYQDSNGQEQWIATGDQGLIDMSGAVYVYGRYKDLIIRGGINISPMSIEETLTTAAGVNVGVIAAC